MVPVFIAISSSGVGHGSVVRYGDLIGLDLHNVPLKGLVVPPHFLGRFPTNRARYVVPPVGCVLVVHHQGLLELLVLLRCPRGGGGRGRAT